jgi:integrase
VDVDLERGILYIRRTKFGKSRYVPVHASTVAALKKYAEVRDRAFPAPLIPAFSFPRKVVGSQNGWRDTPSPNYPNESASAHRPRGTATVRGCRICVIDLLRAP